MIYSPTSSLYTSPATSPRMTMLTTIVGVSRFGSSLSKILLSVVVMISVLLPHWGYATFATTDCPLLEGYFAETGRPLDDNDPQNAWTSLFVNAAGSPEHQALRIYPVENIQQALENLKGYCCQQGYKKDGFCQSVNVDAPRWAESRFLYDHLIDVGFRHLDGVTAASYRYANMAPEPDEQGAERRDTITKKALSTSAVIPLDIVNTFERYRYDKTDGQITPSIARIQHIDTNANFAQAMQQYAGSYQDVGLASKYYMTCYTALFLNPSKTKNGSKKSNYIGCKQLANERINKEVAYVKVLAVEKGAQLLQHNLATYTAQYFVQNRMVNLVEKRGNLGSMFNYLARKTQGTHQCSSG